MLCAYIYVHIPCPRVYLHIVPASGCWTIIIHHIIFIIYHISHHHTSHHLHHISHHHTSHHLVLGCIRISYQHRGAGPIQRFIMQLPDRPGRLRTHSIVREHILENTFYSQRTHSVVRDHILLSENTF